MKWPHKQLIVVDVTFITLCRQASQHKASLSIKLELILISHKCISTIIIRLYSASGLAASSVFPHQTNHEIFIRRKRYKFDPVDCFWRINMDELLMFSYLILVFITLTYAEHAQDSRGSRIFFLLPRIKKLSTP